jgi:hypothetical protein
VALAPGSLSPSEPQENPTDNPSQNKKLKSLPNVRAGKAKVYDADGDPTGVNRRQDAWAQLVAGYTDGVDDSVLIAAYLSIPGVDTDEHGAHVAITRYKSLQAVQDRIEQYRRVLGTSKLSLLANRELVHSEIETRWRNDPQAKVRTADLLVSLKDRESVHGLHSQNSQQSPQAIMDHPRVKAALVILDAEYSNPKQLSHDSKDITENAKIA